MADCFTVMDEPFSRDGAVLAEDVLLVVGLEGALEEFVPDTGAESQPVLLSINTQSILILICGCLLKLKQLINEV